MCGCHVVSNHPFAYRSDLLLVVSALVGSGSRSRNSFGAVPVAAWSWCSDGHGGEKSDESSGELHFGLLCGLLFGMGWLVSCF